MGKIKISFYIYKQLIRLSHIASYCHIKYSQIVNNETNNLVNFVYTCLFFSIFQ